MFCFSRANHASTNLKKFSSSKLDKFTLFTHSFVDWNLENLYKQAVSTFFRLSWHFKRKKSVCWKASFCKTTTDYTCTRLVTVLNSPNPSSVYIRLCKHRKRFLLLKWEYRPWKWHKDNRELSSASPTLHCWMSSGRMWMTDEWPPSGPNKSKPSNASKAA